MAFGSDNRFSLRAAQMTRGQAEAAQIDVGLREYMLRVYNYMASGLALTGIIAMFTAQSETMMQVIFGGGPLTWIIMLSPLGFVLAL